MGLKKKTSAEIRDEFNDTGKFEDYYHQMLAENQRILLDLLLELRKEQRHHALVLDSVRARLQRWD